MRILIVDDEAPARSRLGSLVREINDSFELIGEADNGRDAVSICQAQSVDIVLMDIRMPVMDGLTAARELSQMEHPPAVIFTTAYDEHALAAFDANAVDYLLKPVRKERLSKSLSQASGLTRAQLSALDGLQQEEVYLSASYRGGLQRIPLSKVIYLHADQKYVQVKHTAGEALIEDSLNA